MATSTRPDLASLQAAVEAAQIAVTTQADAVRALKASLKEGKADRTSVDAEIERLKNLKLDAEAAQKALEAVAGRSSSSSAEAFRSAVANALERRLFYLPSFKIYGAVAGFYDYGPPGCAVKANITAAWRAHFVLEEGMLEVECPAVTPEPVLKASGHVDRFTDFMVADTVTGDCHRADHLLEAVLQKAIDDTANPLTPHQRKEAIELQAVIEELTADGLGEALARYNVVAPDTGNPLTSPYAFNLMFKTSIGPRGDQVGYLRPETAQGIFVNFKDLLYYNGGRLPFAAAQIGQSYRNEINPRQGLLRVREFTQAEIEHFCNPAEKDHPKFASVAHLKPMLFSRALQMGETKAAEPMELGKAVADGIIANETLAYFIGRTFQFFTAVGINPEKMRFRQHLVHEMAHYAEDCWDAEVHTTYGWVECAGLADRSAYDLNAHAEHAKTDMKVFEKFEQSVVVQALKAVPDRKSIGMAFKKDAKAITDALAELQRPAAEAMRDALASAGEAPLQLGCNGPSVTLKAEHVKFEEKEEKVTGKYYTPSVIEPSFGIGRIIYCMFEHCYYARDGDDKRSVFKFTPAIAPVKATVFPLLARPEMRSAASALAAEITAAGVSNIVDNTATTIGRRYARTDEIGVPFGVTVDGQTAEDGTATVRERDSMAQVRVPTGELPALLKALVDGRESWESVAARYPAQEPPKE